VRVTVKVSTSARVGRATSPRAWKCASTPGDGATRTHGINIHPRHRSAIFETCDLFEPRAPRSTRSRRRAEVDVADRLAMTPSSPLALERRSSAGAVSGRRASRRVVDRSAPLGRNDRGCRVLLLRATPRRRDDAARVAVLAAESAGSGRDERHVATTSCSSDATATIRDGTRRRRARGAIARASAASSSSPLSSADWRQNVSVACVMLAVFLHLLGFTVTGPITPGLVTHFALRASDVGVLTAAYPLGMFGALFAWPRLSGAFYKIHSFTPVPVRPR
jgi:hypothetical protein